MEPSSAWTLKIQPWSLWKPTRDPWTLWKLEMESWSTVQAHNETLAHSADPKWRHEPSWKPKIHACSSLEKRNGALRPLEA